MCHSLFNQFSLVYLVTCDYLIKGMHSGGGELNQSGPRGRIEPTPRRIQPKRIQPRPTRIQPTPNRISQSSRCRGEASRRRSESSQGGGEQQSKMKFALRTQEEWCEQNSHHRACTLVRKRTTGRDLDVLLALFCSMQGRSAQYTEAIVWCRKV